MPRVALLALGGDLDHVLDADATVSAAGETAEGQELVLAEPVDELAGCAEQLRRLCRRHLLLGAEDHDPLTVGQIGQHRAHDQRNLGVVIKVPDETLRRSANIGIVRVEGGGERTGHVARLSPTAISSTDQALAGGWQATGWSLSGRIAMLSMQRPAEGL